MLQPTLRVLPDIRLCSLLPLQTAAEMGRGHGAHGSPQWEPTAWAQVHTVLKGMSPLWLPVSHRRCGLAPWPVALLTGPVAGAEEPTLTGLSADVTQGRGGPLGLTEF